MKNGKTTIPLMVYLLIFLLGQWSHEHHRRHLLLYISRTKLYPAPSGYANQWGWMNILSESPLGTNSLGILDKIVFIYQWYSPSSSHHEVGVGGRLKREGKYIYIVMADPCCCVAETNTILWNNYPPIIFFHSFFLNSVAVSAPISKGQLLGFSSLKL